MLLANCVRRINQIQFTKCLLNSAATPKHLHSTVAGQSMHSMHIDSTSMSHLTLLTAKATNVFTNRSIQNNVGHFLCTHRCFSNHKRDANTHKHDSDDDDDDDMDNWHRKLPRFDGYHHSTPSIYLVVKNTLSTLLIRSYFDQQFNRKEFLDGAKQAVQVQ